MQESPYKAFLSLVHFDQETNLLRTQLQDMQKQVQALHATQTTLEQEQAIAQQAWHEARKRVDAHELEMKALEEQRLAKTRLMESASSPKEYQALRKEIDTISYQQNKLEQELIALWNTADARKRAYEARAIALQTEQESIATTLREKDEAMKAMTTRIAEREQEWSAQAQQLPEEFVQKYTMMRMAVTDPVVPVEQEACSVCFGSLTRQDMIALRHNQLLQCKGCYRFLYIPQPTN